MMCMRIEQSLHTFLSTLAGVAAAFVSGATVLGICFTAGAAGAATLGFAAFFSDLVPLAIAEVGDGLIQTKEKVGR